MGISKFILLNTHCSGTRLLLRALDNGTQMQCHRKAFNLTIILEHFAFDRWGSPFYQFRTASLRRRIDSVFRRKQLINDFLTELFTPTDEVKVIGLRLIYEQAAKHPEILEWAVENDIGVIHLLRENSLETVVCTETSLKRGLLHSTSRVESDRTIRLSPARLKRELTKLTQEIEKYRMLLKDTRYLEVSYESLIGNHEAEMRRVSTFLNIPQFAPQKVNLLEINYTSLTEVIENFEEVRRALKGTTFERLLNI